MAENTNPENTTEPTALPTAEELEALSAEAVGEASDAARAEAEQLQGVEASNLTDADVDRLEALANFLDTVDSDLARRETVAAERTARAEAAAQRLNREPADAAGAEAAEVEAAEAEAAVEAVAASAGGARPAPRPAARPVRTPARNAAGPSLIASGGQSLADMRAVTDEFMTRSDGFPQGISYQKGVRDQRRVAQIRRDFNGNHVDNKDFKSVDELMSSLVAGKAKDAKSLVAAGGWCAPSENLYDIPSFETLDGIIDLPTFGVGRGGINFTQGPTFADIYANTGFWQTEAQAIAGDTKACYEVDCPDFTEVRLDAVGICVKAPLLTRAAYSEAIQRWLEGTIVANQHKTAANLIAGMRTALGTALAPVLTGTPVTWSTLSMVEWSIEMQRQAHRLSENEALEVKFPRWVRAVLRADLSNRAGVGLDRITNAVLDDHFADRGAAPQWILNYLEVTTPLVSIAYPATFEFMAYPAGTFQKGTADVVSLDTVYDTADLKTNVYTAAFVEDGVLLAKRRHGGVRVTIPVKVSGQLGALNLDDTLFTAQVPNAGTPVA